MKTCPTCNAEYADTFKVCPRDGAVLTESTVVLEAVPVPPPGGDMLIGRTLADRFRIVAKLGEGGMGAVYKAEHTKMDRLCAIKILSPQVVADAEAVARFNREANMSSKIEHAHAVTIYDYGEAEGGLIYLAMEYIEGETLSDVLKREGAFPAERAVKIARQCADALDAAHALNIVHRDLKPDNIMLARKARAGDYVKVLDFGIAKMTESDDKRQDLTQAGFVIGTPYYMSPEQVAGHKLDPRSDVYSFALIVYEMLTGKLPFEGPNTQAVMVSRLTTAPWPLREVNPNIPESMERVVMRALVKDRDNRTPSAGQFVAELEAALAGRDPLATQAQRSASTTPVPVGPPPIPGPALGAPPMPAAVPPTDAAPGPLSAGTVVEHAAPAYAAAAAYAPAAPAKKGGAGKVIAIVVLLLFLIGGGGAAIAVYFLVIKQPAETANATTSNTSNSNTSNSNASTGGASPTGTTVSPEASRLYQEGNARARLEDYAGAVELYKKAIAIQPKFPECHENLGGALLELKRYRESISESRLAAEQYGTPKSGNLFFNTGLAWFHVLDYPKAAEAFEKASKLDPDPTAIAYCGYALDNAGDKAGARAKYQEYLAKAPGGDDAVLVSNILQGREKAPQGEGE